MKLPLRLTIALAIALAASSLVVGALLPVQAGRPGDSPYVSAMSDLTVKSAYAIQCNTICYQDQPNHFICIHDEELSNWACSPSGDHTQCTNLTNICP